jgi:hypothetical protein
MDIYISIPLFFILIAFGLFYFLPSLLAAVRKHRYMNGIFLLNIFLGWTVFGWIIALVWATTRAIPEKAYRQHRRPSLPWLRTRMRRFHKKDAS